MRVHLFVALVASLLPAVQRGPITRAEANAGTRPTLEAELTDAPQVPSPQHRPPAKVIVEIEVQEVTRPIADGATYTFWTFGGRVPGKFIRVLQGDTVEVHLKNHPANRMPHNIDLHAATGPGGGAASTFTAPGHESQFTFKALNPGLFVYHCASAPVGLHVANGMYGLILVEPPQGLPPVDREYYVMQGDFYTSGRFRERGPQTFDLQKALDERPSYVVFNGADGSLVGERALTARTGERVRLFVGNGGPNLVSSFHVIGEIFDRVYTEGGSLAQENVQTTLIPAGGSAIVEFTVDAPGTYTLVDHSIFRAFNKGAVGMLRVEGPERRDLYSGRQADLDYRPSRAAEDVRPPRALTVQAQVEEGRKLFDEVCTACHMQQGEGQTGLFPPLAGSPFVTGDKRRAIQVVVGGLTGAVEVNGARYDGKMPSMEQLTDDEVANVLTFLRSSFGNRAGPVAPEDVAAVRAQSAGR